MVPEAVVAMLACARLGAVHSVVFGGFAPHELAVRIDDARPKVLVSASCGIEVARVIEYKPLLDRALDLAEHAPDHVVVLQRPQAEAALTAPRDLDWRELVAGAEPAECVPVAGSDPLYVLYTSGTTAKPKGVVRDNGGHAVALTWSMANIYGIGPGDVWWSASDVGWVVGHSYIVYAPLLVGATTILYEGKPVGTPDAGAFWRVIEEYGVRALFAAPTAIRAVKKEDPDGALLAGHDVSSMHTLFLAGERLDPDTWEWAGDRLGIPVVDHWWQTETGWPIAANLRGLEPMPIKPGSPTVAVPGWDVQVLDAHGQPVPAGTEGAICVRLPLPPGALLTLWNDDERFLSSYLRAFDGYYLTGDGGYLDEDGYLYVMGRTDDVINVAGHRLSTGSMEAVVASHPDVAECAVIGVHDDLKGQVPRGLVVLKAGVDRDPDELRAELVRAGARRDRRGGVVQARRRRRRAAQDPVRQDPAPVAAGDRRRQGRAGALDHRGPVGARDAPPDPARLAGRVSAGRGGRRSRPGRRSRRRRGVACTSSGCSWCSATRSRQPSARGHASSYAARTRPRCGSPNRPSIARSVSRWPPCAAGSTSTAPSWPHSTLPDHRSPCRRAGGSAGPVSRSSPVRSRSQTASTARRPSGSRAPA